MSDRKEAPSLNEINIVQAILALRGVVIELVGELPEERQKAYLREDGDLKESLAHIKKIMERWEK